MTILKPTVLKKSSSACDDCCVDGSHATRIPHSLPAQAGIQGRLFDIRNFQSSLNSGVLRLQRLQKSNQILALAFGEPRKVVARCAGLAAMPDNGFEHITRTTIMQKAGAAIDLF